MLPRIAFARAQLTHSLSITTYLVVRDPPFNDIVSFASLSSTYIYIDPGMVIENGDLGIVCGDESVELLLVVVPLHGVEMVAL